MKFPVIFIASCLLLGAGCTLVRPTGEPTDAQNDLPSVTDGDVQPRQDAVPQDEAADDEAPTDKETEYPKPDPVTLEMLPSTSTLCTDPPVFTEIGNDVHPIDEQYEGMDYLGQLFTAAKCSPDRVNAIWGMRNGTYILGSSLSLNEAPDEELLNTLKWIGFTCKENIDDQKCKEWALIKDVPYENLLYLEPFHEAIRRDDCYSCG